MIFRMKKITLAILLRSNVIYVMLVRLCNRNHLTIHIRVRVWVFSSGFSVIGKLVDPKQWS